MFNFLEKLRAKPEKSKRRFAFLVALSVSGLMFAMWLAIVYPQFMRDQSKEAQVAKLTPGPISTFSDTFSSGIQAIGAKISEIKNTVSGLTASAVHYNATTSPISVATTTSSIEE